VNENPHTNERNFEAALEGVDRDEAVRLRELWRLVDDASDSFPTPDEVAAERIRLLHDLDAPDSGAAVLGASVRDRAALDAPILDAAAVSNSRRPRAAIHPLRRSERKRRVWWLAAAAVVAVFFVARWWTTPFSLHAPFGKSLVVTLPDSSTVHLNSGSTLSYGRSFSVLGRRAVQLTGEAFFDIQESDMPFTVTTFDAGVAVIGTRFNVRAWPGEPEGETMVVVESGRVALFASRDASDRVVVEAGQSRRVLNGGVAADSLIVSVEDALAWRDGDLIFKDRPLGVVLADVRRRFATDVRVEPATEETTKINLALRAPMDAEDVVRDIAGALDIRYRTLSHGYVLYQPSGQ
jgi:ferric-dicitrate binding protein FerR (iron transport regulator)